MSKCLSADDILSSNDLKIDKLDVPEWGGHVYIQAMDGFRRDKFEELSTGKNSKHILAKLVAMCVCDEKGRPIFTEKQIAEINKKSAAALNRVTNKIMEMNVMSDSDIDDIAKNS